MGDHGGTPTRERLWITKFDHSTDPPTPVEEVFVENGRLVSTRAIGPENCARCGAAEIAIETIDGGTVRRYCAACAPEGIRAALVPGATQQEEETDGRDPATAE